MEALTSAAHLPSSFARPFLPILASALLLILAFPSFNQTWAAWVALVPWLIVLRGLTPRRAFWWSYLVGLMFFLGSIWWLIHVTIVGWLLLCAYLALYFAAFGWIAQSWLNTAGSRKQEAGSRKTLVGTYSLLPASFSLLLIPAAWVALEYLRAHLLSGFGWNLLGYSQTSWLPIIQLADVTGVWGMSCVIVMVNVAIAQALVRRPVRKDLPAMMVVVSCVAAAWFYGQHRLGQSASSRPITIAVVQGNIPQERKWEDASRETILQQYERLTRAATGHQVSLIVWPETSVPGFVGWDPVLTTRLQHTAQTLHVPLLVGTPAVAFDHTVKFMNSAVLLNDDGAIAGRYNKLHLVPFGEFIPLESVMPWLRSILPPIGDFLPGKEHTIFAISVRNSEFGVRNDNSALQFSALICFEDLFPDLARRFVTRGAQMLAVITNDAWFGPTAAAYQHAQASTFRAVELRVPVVRAANTGWSGCIDAAGRWTASIHAEDGRDRGGTIPAAEAGRPRVRHSATTSMVVAPEVSSAGGPTTELFVEGVAACEVSVGAETTLYRRWGDWFAFLCLGVCLGGVIFAIMTPRY